MKVSQALILTAGLLLTNAAFADDGAALMKKNNCSACHQLDKKTVGPGLKMIAAKYAGDAGAVEKLAKKVRTGGAGNWGSMAMPPLAAKVTDDEIKAMVETVLATK